MTKEYTHENLPPRDQLPSEPDFHNAINFLKAQPVVPLKPLERKFHCQGKWIVCGMFAITMLLGAVSGLISAYFQLRETPEALVIQSDISSSATPEEFSSTVSDESQKNGIGTVLVESASIDEPPLKQVTPKRAMNKPKPDKISPNPLHPLSTLSEEDDLRRIRESLLIEDSKKLRATAVEKRQQRRFERDLFN